MNRLEQRLERLEKRDNAESVPVLEIWVPADHPIPIVDNKVWFLSDCRQFKYMPIKCASKPVHRVTSSPPEQAAADRAVLGALGLAVLRDAKYLDFPLNAMSV